MTSSHAPRPRIVSAAALALCTALAGSLRAQERPIPSPARGQVDARVIEVPDSAAVVQLWARSGGTASWYIVSEDGVAFSRPRQADGRLHLRYRTFDPLTEPVDIDARLQARGDNRLHIVQYHTQGLGAYREALRQLGGEVLLYVPRHANVVEMDATTAAAAAQLSFVRSVTPYHPAFRLEPELREAIARGITAPVKVNLLTTRRGPVAQRPVGDWVRAQGGSVDAVSAETYLMTVTLPAPLLPGLAALNDVQWVDRWTPIESEGDMNIARTFHGANHVESQVNALGQGVRIEVLDGGCETIHPDLQNFIVHSPTNTPSSHGTACSGIVLGSGAGNFSARGAMPQATLIIGDYSYLAGGSRYAHSAQLVNPGLVYKCVAQSNSWGNSRTRAYTSITQDLDVILFDLENLSITQSQSNAGNQDSRPQAWAKNIISVGGIRHFNTTSKSDDSWSGGASIGPAADGRIKPDLASFYDNILCTDRVGSAGYASGNYTSGFGGTSGATPIVAGMLGLFYQLWHQGTFGNTPGATVFDSAPKNTTAKAFLIAAASQWTFSGSGADLARVKQGWGHPDLQKTLDNASEIFWVDESDILGNLQSTTYDLDVAAGTPELKVTMVYRDPGGTTSASLHRINDLDVRVMSPSGTVYHGNNGLSSANYSSAGGSPNTVDTVENVFVQSPQVGTWQVTVTAAALNQDSHPETGAMDADYALVVLGGTPNTGPTPPAPPTSLAANATSSSSVTLSWNDNSSNEDDFELQRGPGAGGPFSTIATLAANTTGYVDNGLAAGTTYHYRVRANNTAGSSAWSNTANATTLPNPPAAPSNLVANATGETTIALGWNDNSGTEDGFELQRATSAGGPFSTIANLGANTTSYGDSGLSPSTTYFYRVRANNTGGSSAWSNTASATTQDPPSPPAAPSNLAANSTGQTTIALTWNDNSGTEDGFELQRATSAGGPFSTIANLGANTTSYGDSGLTAATTYFYRVRANNAGGSSAWSNTASATTDPPSSVDYTSNRGRLRKGTQSGSHTDTHTANGVYHVLTEHLYRSNRSRHNFDYYFNNLPAGTKTLHIKAHHTSSSDNEDWKVQYRNGGSWVDLITITKTAENGQYQTAVVPTTGSGTVRIRVRDIKRGKNQPVLDSCFVDHLFVRM